MKQSTELFDTKPFKTVRSTGTLGIEGTRTSMKPATWMALVHLQETLDEASRNRKVRESQHSRN